MRYTIDRITEKFVVLDDENGVVGNVDKFLFPSAKEGDILEIVTVAKEKSEKTEGMKTRLHSLFQKGNGNDKN